MRRLSCAVTALLLSSGLSTAAEPVGEWMVEDKIATIRIENCQGRMWGVVAWEKDPGFDTNNPDPEKRSRPTLGLPIILGMQQTEANRWQGHIYNTNDGRTYPATIRLSSPDVLRVEGCLLGFLCGGQDWTRVKAEKTEKPGPRVTAGARQQNAPRQQQAAGSDVCARLELSGVRR